MESESTPIPQVKESKDFLELVNEIKNECDLILKECPNEYGLILFEQLGSLIPPDIEKVDPNTDLDIECISKDTLTEEQKKAIQKRINNIFQQRNQKIPLELFFRTKAEFEQGLLSPPDQTGHGQLHCLSKEFDPKKETPQWLDPSLGTIYVYSTMSLFSNEDSAGYSQRKEWLENGIKQAIENTQLTALGAIDWIHKYMKSFLSIYQSKEDSENYAKSISKLLCRIFLGYAVANAEQSELPKIKNNLFAVLRKAGRPDYSNDQAIAEFIISNLNPSYLNIQQRQLLRAAGKIRSGSKRYYDWIIEQTDAENQSLQPRKYFYETAEAMIVNLASQVGASMRRDQVSEYDLLVGIGLEVLLEQMKDQFSGQINFKEFEPGETIIKKSEEDQDNQWCYVLPDSSDAFFEIERDGSVFVKAFAGQVAGELGALYNAPRTADVKIKRKEGETEKTDKIGLYQINGSFLRHLFKDEGGKIKQSLRDPKSATDPELLNKMRLANLFLNYLSYEFIRFVRDLSKSRKTEQKETTVQTPDNVRKNNPFESFFVDDYAENIQAMFKQDNIPLEEMSLKEEVLFNKDEEILFQDTATKKRNDYFYVVLEGEVIIDDFENAPNSRIVLPPNSVFGEAVLIREKTRSARAITEKKAKLLKIPVSEFERLTGQEKIIADTGYSQREMLFHIAAVNADRVIWGLYSNRFTRQNDSE